MLGKLKNRFLVMIVLICTVFVVLCAQLGDLTLAKGGDFAGTADVRKQRTLAQKGARGQILDATGIPLAYDQNSFNVELVRDPSKNTPTDKAYYTDVIAQTVKIIEANEGEIANKFAILRTNDGSFAFDFGITNKEDIAKREKNWRKNMFVSEKSTPDVIYRDLRNRYRIPEEMPYEEAIKVLGIWQDIQLSSYRAFIPIVIARNVDMQTVAEIESKSDILDGVQISEASMRIYPKDDVAAHIIGYMGKMTDKDIIEEYESRGYSSEDLVGVSGIESSMEQYLTGNSKEKQGIRKVEVNSSGKVIKDLDYTPPKSGDSVMLTIDLGLQMVAEQALKKNVESIGQMWQEQYLKDKAKYDEQYATRDPKFSNSGAAVVMDVNSGKVLAMANYPSYDINIFTNGISASDFNEIKNTEGSPLFNKAIASKGIPGSIFKLVTGLAGLSEGVITPTETITDLGPYDKYVKEANPGEITGSEFKAPACWAHPDVSAHANLDIHDALKVSCNYYFFETADRLGIDKLNYWSDSFGLTSLTNIELAGEYAGQVGNPAVLYNGDNPLNKQKTDLPTLVKNSIARLLEKYGKERGVKYKDAQIEQAAQELVALAKKNTTQIGPEIRTILSEQLEIPETITKRNGWENDIAGYIADLIWNPTRTVNTGIGVGITAITPIATARYVSAIANEGTVYDARLVDRIIDENGDVIEQKESTVFNKIDQPAEYFQDIKEGMRRMVAEGNAKQFFEDFKYKDNMAGKTGTGKVNKIDLDNNAWFVAYAPLENPEIAVVVYIPTGIAGSNAIPTAKEIIGYYLGQKEKEDVAVLPSPNTLVVPKEDLALVEETKNDTPLAVIAD